VGQIYSDKLMEIHILLAGVEFGPYTDDKARELVADGFLAESDPAKRLDETDWIPLGDLLASASGETNAGGGEQPFAFLEEPPEDHPLEPSPSRESRRMPSRLSVHETRPMTTSVSTRASAPEFKPTTAPMPSHLRTQDTAPLTSPLPLRKKVSTAPSSAPPAASAAPPMIHVTLPSRAKPKAPARTGSLLAKEALDAARARVGASPQAPQTVSLPALPEPTPPEEPPPTPTPPAAEPPAASPAPRQRSKIVLKNREETTEGPTGTSPAKAGRRPIRLTGPISLSMPLPEVAAPAAREVLRKETGKIPSEKISRLKTSGRITPPVEEEAPPSAPENISGPLLEPAAPSSPALTASGDLAEKRSLKITGALKQASPRTPIRLTTSLPTFKPEESARLAPPGDEVITPRAPSRTLPGEKKIWGPQAPVGRAPFSPTSKIPPSDAPIGTPRFETRPPSGKIPVSEMPPEGLKVRSTRRLTGRVPLPPQPPELPPETPPPPEIAEALAPAPDLDKPEKIRLRRPVKLELSSRAKHPDSGRLTLEAFSQMGSAELPQVAPPATPPPLASASQALTPVPEAPFEEGEVFAPFPHEVEEPAETVPLSKLEQFRPPRLTEVPPQDLSRFESPRLKQPWMWLFYGIIGLGGLAAFIILYLATRPVSPSHTSTVSPSGEANPAANAPATPVTPAPSETPAAPAATAMAQQVDAYIADGMSSYERGDLDASLAAFNHALDLNPKSADALYHRGITKAAQDDMDGAIADYSQALQIDSKMSLAYYYRGLARHSKGDLDGAVGDYNLAVQMDPKYALAYFNRGLIRMQKDDIDGAIVDSGRALELDPHLIQSYYNRGLGRLAKGALDAALSDMKTFCVLAPQDAYTDYARLYIWLIRTQQNQLAEANQELTQAMNSGWNGSADSMVTKIGEFLLGQISESDLIAASASPIPVKDQGQRCEAWYFIGMRRLEAGDRETAAADLQKCVETQKTDYCEYILAQEQLKTLSPAGAATSKVVTPPPAK
jgi:lipoprotein NlpI